MRSRKWVTPTCRPHQETPSTSKNKKNWEREEDKDPYLRRLSSLRSQRSNQIIEGGRDFAAPAVRALSLPVISRDKPTDSRAGFSWSQETPWRSESGSQPRFQDS
ncbi:hypothetical protein chiPu_0000389 [Chiloscyllium punctatum]|uniref:Uncharacterized protein n=1 Tax=Chiloscyllium punctatum TaxID=137246 RepID=A0A401RV28_CHIPU|nr:hypothetical protein [Chiloscyllium punctatum]